MKTKFRNKPRIFMVKGTKLTDFGKIHLNDGELVSFVTKSGRECDFVARDWGFYLGPSLNSRLKNEGFKAALVLNPQGQVYINAVETGKMKDFKRYIEANQSRVICWLDEWVK